MEIAIITPGIQPVPALNGGAVESLIEELILQNELYKEMHITLYTIPDKRYKKNIYNYCNVVEVKSSGLIKCKVFIKKIFYKYILRKKTDFTIKSLQYTLSLKKLLNREKNIYDYIILENNMKIYEYLKSEIKNKSKKFIFHLHNEILGSDRPYELCKDIIENAHAVLAVSHYLKNRLNDVYFSNKNKVFYNCVNFEIFNENRFNANDYKQLRQTYGINLEDYVYLYTGRINRDKGILDLVKAFDMVAKDRENLKLVVVGNSWFGKKRKNKFEIELSEYSRKLKDKIVFTGYIDHSIIPNMLLIADCIVIPSKWEEPFGVVALEAMAMKKTIISTNSGGLLEQLDESRAIIVDKSENLINNLKDAMIKVKDNTLLCKNLSNNAYKYVHTVTEFDNKYYYQNFINLIK